MVLRINSRTLEALERSTTLDDRAIQIMDAFEAGLPRAEALRQLEALKAEFPDVAAGDNITEFVEADIKSPRPDEFMHGVYLLCGYATQADYEAQTPTWTPEDAFEAIPAGERAARVWLAGQGLHAQVEVVRFEKDTGTVVALVSHGGTRLISQTSDPSS